MFRSNIKPFQCLPNVNCGDYIDANWANEIKNLGVSAFMRGETVLYSIGPTVGNTKVPLVGFQNNYIKSYGNNSERHVTWHGGTQIRFQPAIHLYHNCQQLYEGNTAIGPYGDGIDTNGIHGVQHPMGSFENAGYDNILVTADVRRGKRCVANTDITTNSSDTHIFELNEDDNDPLGYEQHIECWYCREVGGGFPPQKVLLFNDADCPIRTYKTVSKVVPLPFPPSAGQTEIDYIIVSVWYSAPYYVTLPGYPGQPGFSVPNGLFVMGTSYFDWQNNPDGLLNLSIKLFKDC